MDDITYESMSTSILWMKRLLFAGVFIQENKLHTIYDRYNDITSKQWLLMAVCSAYPSPPDLTTLGVAMGCSRQNVKKLAEQLVKNNYMELIKSKTDSRSVCVVITEQGNAYLQKCGAYAEQVFNTMFCEFTDDEIKQYYQMSVKVMKGIDHLEELFKSINSEEQMF